MATTKETPASSVGRATSTTATGTNMIPTHSFAMRRASPPRDAIYTENESLLTSPGPSDMQNNTNNAKKSSNILTTKTAVDVKENAAAQLVPAPAVVAKEYRGKIACPACAKDFEGSSKLRVHVIKCRGAHAGGSKMLYLLTTESTPTWRLSIAKLYSLVKTRRNKGKKTRRLQK